MLIDRANLAMHRRWIVLVLVAGVVAVAWYFFVSGGAVVEGNTLPGLTFGIIGGSICLFEFLLWPRKALRRYRLGKTQIWMRAHIWLGLLAVPILVLHSGLRFGGLLSSVLMWLFIIVIVSGVVGLWLQHRIPRALLETVPGETIFSQIDHVSALFAEQAEAFVLATCGAGEGQVSIATASAGGGSASSQGDVMLIGRPRDPMKVLRAQAPPDPVPGAEPLRSEFYAKIKPYLLKGKRSGSPLRDGAELKMAFRRLRDQLDPSTHDGINAIEECCDQRRMFDRQAKLHFWLHSWLSIHLPLSVALIVLMFVHVWMTLKYM